MDTDLRDDEQAADPLWDSERIVSDSVGRLMELWGFKHNLGRVWTVLYLAGEPLTAQVLRDKLQLSSGAVSMTLSELSRWGVVRKSWVQGDRRDFYEAEANVWKMISRVIREREQAEIAAAIEAFEDALVALERQVELTGVTPRVRVQRERIGKLLELAKLGRSMLDALIANARLDASWLPRFKLGRR
jgi:DNA-binding transcriptional regulator GbsR (MarR family)